MIKVSDRKMPNVPDCRAQIERHFDDCIRIALTRTVRITVVRSNWPTEQVAEIILRYEAEGGWRSIATGADAGVYAILEPA